MKCMSGELGSAARVIGAVNIVTDTCMLQACNAGRLMEETWRSGPH